MLLRYINVIENYINEYFAESSFKLCYQQCIFITEKDNTVEQINPGSCYEELLSVKAHSGMKISTSYFFYLIDFTVLCGKASACLRSNCAEAINAYDAMYIQSGTCKRKIFSSVVKNSIVSIKHYLCVESHKAVNMKTYSLVFHFHF